MEPAALSSLAAWESFYVIVGSSAAALTGLPTLLVSASLLEGNPAAWLFPVGAAALFLLFISIHHAWDAVTYIATESSRAAKAESKPA